MAVGLVGMQDLEALGVGVEGLEGLEGLVVDCLEGMQEVVGDLEAVPIAKVVGWGIATLALGEEIEDSERMDRLHSLEVGVHWVAAVLD